jgi:3-oxo-5alpha-steroid 4-dehydrogenase
MRLITENGRVTGVECRSLRGAPLWVRAAHRLTHRAALKPYLYVPKIGRAMRRPAAWLERHYGRPRLVGATNGVVIAAGGFGANRSMLRAHTPSARGALPLATPGDDGSGVLLGTGAGGAAAGLDRVSVWRFLSPPPALARGILVRPGGKRICDESRYRAANGERVSERYVHPTSLRGPGAHPDEAASAHLDHEFQPARLAGTHQAADAGRSRSGAK